MTLTSQQESTLRSLISSHHQVRANQWPDESLTRYRARLVQNARRGTLTHEDSLIVAGFGVAMLEPSR